MVTTWKDVCKKLKMNGMGASAPRRARGSVDSITSTSEIDTALTTSSNTPPRRVNRTTDNEWQMNYMIINRRDGL